MTKSSHYQRIESFMKLAGQEVPATPQIPSKEVRLLRAKLILEEALETINALGCAVYHQQGIHELTMDSAHLHLDYEPNLVEIADGCADISVVTIGTLIACGIHDTELLEEVDKSNLAKFVTPRCKNCCSPTRLLPGTEGVYECLRFDCEYRIKGPYRRSDGKWIKPPDWKKPDIQQILDAQVECIEMYDGDE